MTQTTLIQAADTTPSNVLLRVMLKQLHIHDAHDRTRYDLDKLAGLTLQVVERNLDEWQPVTAALAQPANGKAAQYRIISGHRRWLARILAYAVLEWAKLPDHQARTENGIDLPFVRELLVEIVQTLTGQQRVEGSVQMTLSAESVHTAITQLLQLYGENEITIAEFKGGAKAQMLALQAANSNREDPDPLGLARSYHAAFEVGATPTEIARHSGVHTDYVLNHLALTQIDPAIATAISEDKLPMGIARQLVRHDNPLKAGLTNFVLLSLAPNGTAVTVSSLKQIAKQFKNWHGLQVPLSGLQRQSQRNMARILSALWQKSVDGNAAHAWTAAVQMAAAGYLKEAWLDSAKTTAWFEVLDTQRKYRDADNNLNWQTIVADLLLPVSCETCPIGKLPRVSLQSDIGEGRDGATGIPCRLHAAGEHRKCLHGYAPDDSLQVPVPFDWATHNGVERENGGYVVKTEEALQQAWQAQLKDEGGRMKDEEATPSERSIAPSAASDVKRTRVEPIPDGSIQTSTIEASSPIIATATTPVQPTEKTESTSGGDSKTQARIRQFMESTAAQSATHPFATPCASCRHKLDSSPVKSRKNAPYCAWAKGSRSLSFTQLNPTEKDTNFAPIPVCRQYAPKSEWRDLIPTHAGNCTLPRTWLTTQITELIEQMSLGRSRVYSGHTAKIAQYPLEFLTGRPMGSNENHANWFKDRFQEEQGNLSDGQMMTLFIWVMAERRRLQQQSFLLPTDGSATQFVRVQEKAVNKFGKEKAHAPDLICSYKRMASASYESTISTSPAIFPRTTSNELSLCNMADTTSSS